MHVVANEDAAQLLEHQDQPVRHQHLLQMFALVQEAEEAPLEQITERDRQQQTERECREESTANRYAHPRRKRIGHVRADHVEAAVREIDHAHDPEDQRQAARDQEQQQPVLDCVQALDQESGEVHLNKTAVRSFPRTAVYWSFPSYILQPVAGSANPLTATF